MTVENLEFYQTRAKVLAAANVDRDKVIDAIDDMDHGVWEEPEEFSKIPWVDPMVSTEPHDVLQAGTRIISDSEPKFIVLPRSIQGDDADRADAYERGIKSLFMKANRRREATVVADAGFSVLKNAEVAIHVMFVPQQIESVKDLGGDANRYEAIQRGGDFVYTVHNAKNINARYSDTGLEELVCTRVIDPQEVIDLYPKQTAQLQAQLAQATKQGVALANVLHKDYYSYSARVMWIQWTDVNSSTTTMADEIIREEWAYPFIPWACKIVGTSTEGEAKFRRRPLLYTAHHFNLFDELNRVRSLRFSEMVRYAGTPRKAFKSDTRESPDVDAASPDLTMRLHDDEEIRELTPPLPDPSMGLLHTELRQDLETATLSKILMGAQPPAQAAFSTVNLVTHSAMATLKPYIECLEQVIGMAAEISMLWLHYSPAANETITEGIAEEDLGQDFTLKGSDINPKRLMVLCELSPDVPTDRQARALTAINLNERGIISKRQAMSDIGVTDAVKMEEQIWQERMDENEAMLQMKNRATTSDVQTRQQMLEQAMMIIQQQMLKEQAARAAEAGAPVEEGGRSLMPGAPGGSARAEMEGPRGMMGVEGDLVDPNQGGNPAAMLDPNMRRETQTGRTRAGEEIA